ncbi:hypothetical protein F4808DRAFT_419623 [Astrocystis sublimbata]|nr:hypothetical protein F4808DRAFT_419623 [Astrocystis sublimbata]
MRWGYMVNLHIILQNHFSSALEQNIVLFTAHDPVRRTLRGLRGFSKMNVMLNILIFSYISMYNYLGSIYLGRYVVLLVLLTCTTLKLTLFEQLLPRRKRHQRE